MKTLLASGVVFFALASPGAAAFRLSALINYGNYCGPLHSAGRDAVAFSQLDWCVAAIDKMDDFCRVHDVAYESFDPADRLAADKDLLAGLQGVTGAGMYPDDAKKAARAEHYRLRAIALFERLIPAREKEIARLNALPDPYRQAYQQFYAMGKQVTDRLHALREASLSKCQATGK